MPKKWCPSKKPPKKGPTKRTPDSKRSDGGKSTAGMSGNDASETKIKTVKDNKSSQTETIPPKENAEQKKDVKPCICSSTCSNLQKADDKKYDKDSIITDNKKDDDSRNKGKDDEGYKGRDNNKDEKDSKSNDHKKDEKLNFKISLKSIGSEQVIRLDDFLNLEEEDELVMERYKCDENDFQGCFFIKKQSKRKATSPDSNKSYSYKSDFNKSDSNKFDANKPESNKSDSNKPGERSKTNVKDEVESLPPSALGSGKSLCSCKRANQVLQQSSKVKFDSLPYNESKTDLDEDTADQIKDELMICSTTCCIEIHKESLDKILSSKGISLKDIKIRKGKNDNTLKQSKETSCSCRDEGSDNRERSGSTTSMMVPESKISKQTTCSCQSEDTGKRERAGSITSMVMPQSKVNKEQTSSFTDKKDECDCCKPKNDVKETACSCLDEDNYKKRENAVKTKNTDKQTSCPCQNEDNRKRENTAKTRNAARQTLCSCQSEDEDKKRKPTNLRNNTKSGNDVIESSGSCQCGVDEKRPSKPKKDCC